MFNYIYLPTPSTNLAFCYNKPSEHQASEAQLSLSGLQDPVRSGPHLIAKYTDIPFALHPDHATRRNSSERKLSGLTVGYNDKAMRNYWNRKLWHFERDKRSIEDSLCGINIIPLFAKPCQC